MRGRSYCACEDASAAGDKDSDVPPPDSELASRRASALAAALRAFSARAIGDEAFVAKHEGRLREFAYKART